MCFDECLNWDRLLDPRFFANQVDVVNHVLRMRGAVDFGNHHKSNLFTRFANQGFNVILPNGVTGVVYANTDTVQWIFAAMEYVDDQLSMLALLTSAGKADGRDYTTGLINSQVVPSYDNLAVSSVREYRELMTRHHPVLPTSLAGTDYLALDQAAHGEHVAPERFHFGIELR